MSIRVAVTGIGVKTPAGNDLTTVLDTLASGRSVAATVDALVVAGAPVTFACTVPDFDPTPYCQPRQRRQLDRATLLVLAAALDAVAGARVAWPADPSRAGVCVGVGMGGLAASEHTMREYGSALPAMPAYTVPRIMANSAAARISIRLGVHGPALTYAAACASGAIAIGEAAMKIRSGEWDLAVAGGADSAVMPGVMTAFAHSGALSRRNHDPATASRPFDGERDGFVMGEGAAMLVLERLDRANARGAPVAAELVGFAANSDAHHIVAPQADGSMAVRCMEQAVADAGVQFADIGHVNAHGTSTVLNDRAEALALATCFGARCPPVTAPKSVVGHMIGGAGALEAVLAATTATSGVVPPVANFGGGELGNIVDVVAGTPRVIGQSLALSNSFGFGGHNACLVFAPGSAPTPGGDDGAALA